MSARDDRKAAIKKLKLLAYTSKQNVNAFRKKIEDTYYTPILPNHVERQEHNYGGVKCDVLSPELYSSRRVLFYIHGGSFVGGSRSSYRAFCSILANRTFSRVVVPEYRLAPTYAFPSAIEDIQAVFRALFTEEQIARSLDSTIGPDGKKQEVLPEFIIASDGAGASIAMALLLNLRERYRKCIKKVILLSPWLNLSSTSPILNQKKAQDEIISKDVLLQSAEVYTYSSNLENPLVSPVLASAEQLVDFPSTYIQMGEKEILLEDAKEFNSKLHASGVESKLDVFPDMMHLFQLAEGILEESHDALSRIAEEVSGCTENTERQTYDNKPRLEQSLKAEA